ncbi:MAG: hypothetical protein ACRBDL_09350 [Alphaproteobacteria bacterium]
MAKRTVYYGTSEGTAYFIESAQCEYDVPPSDRDPKSVTGSVSEANARNTRSLAEEALWQQMNNSAGTCFKPRQVSYDIREKEIED